MKKLTSGIIGISLVFALLTGCGELNDNPSPSKRRMTVDIGNAKKVLGFSQASVSTKNIYVPEDTPATSEIKSLMVGAMVVTKRTTPYTNDMTITDQVMDDASADIANSINFLKIVQLPTSMDFIEFDIPPPSAEKWQIIMVGLRTAPLTVSELSNDGHKNSPAYYGFSDNFITADEAVAAPITLTLKRACLLSVPPKGCAIFSDTLTNNPVVSAGVEIVGIKINDMEYTPVNIDLPIIVSDDASVDAAKLELASFRDNEIIGTFDPIDSLSIITTHAQNPAESLYCRALFANTDATSGDYIEACEESEYRSSMKP
ncbi:MAG: hypothetical protein OEY59_06810 [Deltaproteobacteria bacterium]|nr:hypothetical protein [Deltaproteobacteria bacterium]